MSKVVFTILLKKVNIYTDKLTIGLYLYYESLFLSSWLALLFFKKPYIDYICVIIPYKGHISISTFLE